MSVKAYTSHLRQNMAKCFARGLKFLPQAPQNWDTNGDGAYYVRSVLDSRNLTCREKWELTLRYCAAKLLDLSNDRRVYLLTTIFHEILPKFYEQHKEKPALLKWALVVKKWL